ncbi:hypothetical protein ACWU4D_04350 [Vibrio sp. WJH972]
MTTYTTKNLQQLYLVQRRIRKIEYILNKRLTPEWWNETTNEIGLFYDDNTSYWNEEHRAIFVEYYQQRHIEKTEKIQEDLNSIHEEYIQLELKNPDLFIYSTQFDL